MRTRFAPSPTGFLHVGTLRTALYAYLVAKKAGGSFLLRIEDTDQERSVEGAVENILRTLGLCHIEPDEGVMMENGTIVQRGDCGPYVQSERLSMYREYAQKLIESGHAYYAFDTKEEIELMRSREKVAGNVVGAYDSRTRMQMKNSLSLKEDQTKDLLAKGTPHVIRFKVNPDEAVAFQDEIRGRVEFKGATIDDQVLMKSDGFPTYHLAHVVDDRLMEIDLVIRGEEWLPSLPKHILLFRAFGWEPPKYAHVPLLLNKDKSKLSKRQGSVAAEDFISNGYLPEALVNFLALLGWNPGTDQEVLSMEELIAQFSIDRVQKAGAIFDTEKLDWIQGQWMRKMTTEEFAGKIRPEVEASFPLAKSDDGFLRKAALVQERITFLKEAKDMMNIFYGEPVVTPDLLANPKQKVTVDILPGILEALSSKLESIPPIEWTEENLQAKLLTLAEEKGWKKGQLLWPLRAAITGRAFSPGAFEVAAVLGKEETIRRIKMAQ